MVVLILHQIRLESTLILVTRIFVEAEVRIDSQNQKHSEFDFVSCLMSRILHPTLMAMELPSISSTDLMLHPGESKFDVIIEQILKNIKWLEYRRLRSIFIIFIYFSRDSLEFKLDTRDLLCLNTGHINSLCDSMHRNRNCFLCFRILIFLWCQTKIIRLKYM